MNQELVMRHGIVAYCNVPSGIGGVTTSKIYRMKGFTSFGTSRNTEQYTRKYVDEKHQTSDITAYNTSIGYKFDLFEDNPVHQLFADITNNEKIGSEALVDIYVVDFSKPVGSSDDEYECAHRKMVLVPSSDGDDANVYTYSGDLRTKGDREVGVATVSADELTITYSAD